MATLTIKPTAAGNDVQIKSGDGNTTHATFGDTATLGTATIADATITAGTIASGVTFPAGHTKITTITNNTETSFTNATSHYETIGSHTKSVASSIITAMVCLPVQANVADGMWSVPILQLQYGGTVSAVQTGGTFGSTGMGPQVILYGTWTGKSASAHDLKWGWNYNATSSKPGITTWNPDETIDGRMTQSATYAIVMEVFV